MAQITGSRWLPSTGQATDQKDMMNESVQEKYGSSDRKYHRVVVTQHGGPNVLQMVEEDLPEPQPGEVRVKILCSPGIGKSRRFAPKLLLFPYHTARIVSSYI